MEPDTALDFVINHYFLDSLALGKAINMHEITYIGDIGASGWLPGLVLKIKFPHLKVLLKLMLTDVTNTTIWLEKIIKALNLIDIEINVQDWCMFLRETKYPIELFCARNSLEPSELIRAFDSLSFYKKSTIVYWASAEYEPVHYIQSFVQKITFYVYDRKKLFFDMVDYKPIFFYRMVPIQKKLIHLRNKIDKI